MPMTPASKKLLSSTIRALRERLLQDLHAATEASYRLSVRAQDAGLPEAARVRRDRLDAWIAEQLRAEAGTGKKGKQPRDAEAFRREVEQQAAYTLLNRLVILRLMEAGELRAPAVVTGGWDSRGYKDFRSLAPALVRGDESEGYAFLLRLVFEDLAHDLPGIFGPAGVAELVPVPPATLRHVVEALDQPELESCWTDDMTLGWVYQYWNDPEREALDAKLNAGGKVEPHEIASKTQMFTERYMVDWLLQNSLGPMWLAMCRKQGWTPEVESDGTLERLEQRRADWRGRRERGEVALTELMPLHSDAERRWAYYLPQPIPGDAVAQAPDSVRDIKLLDPALGSGHFLVVAFELLFALYREESRQRRSSSTQRREGAKTQRVFGGAERSAQGRAGGGTPELFREDEWTDGAIAERILSHNLHGIDLDARAVQIAAAALWMKARQHAPEARPSRMNLVASNLRLASLPDDDPALVELRRELERETGIPGALTDTIVGALKGADHLGSLLKVDAAVDTALGQHEAALGRAEPEQGGLFSGFAAQRPRVSIDRDQARATILERLEAFLARHTRGEDLGLRLRGEQLAAGVRFVRLVQEGQYHLVVGNPPYQGTSKMADAAWVQQHYPRGKADLYAAFLERGLQLARPGGTSALLTMRNWMFIKQYTDLRTWLLEHYDLRALGDFDRGAFEEVPDEVVSVVVSVFRRAEPSGLESVALQPTPLDDRTRDSERTARKRGAVRCGTGIKVFEPAALAAVPGWPVVYWWTRTFVKEYTSANLVQDVAVVRLGLSTSNNPRFLRRPWEAGRFAFQRLGHGLLRGSAAGWVPLVSGAAGSEWFAPVEQLICWKDGALGMRSAPGAMLRNPEVYFSRGVGFTPIGHQFSGRIHRCESAIDAVGRSVYGHDPIAILMAMNSARGRSVVEDLNPSISFTAGDIDRLPLFPIANADEIFATIEAAFSEHESHREPSVEFTHPGPSPWRHAQDWAQAAVDRPEGAPLPSYEPFYDPEPPTDHIGFALGVALGRFRPWDADAQRRDAEAPRRKEDEREPAPPAGAAAPGTPPRPATPTDPQHPGQATAPHPTTDLSAPPKNLCASAPSRLCVESGILDPATADLTHALPAGILFLDGTLDPADHRDGLGHPAAAPLHAAWATHGRHIDTRRGNLRDYLALDFFGNVHRQLYENRPIHWPLSSSGKTFVAWVNIHRWTTDTLTTLLADHLVPTLTRIDGELADLRAARDGADEKAARAAEKRFATVHKQHQELAAFIADVEACAEQGPPPTDAKCAPRHRDARYVPDLDDGVMINAAALWPLLAPQWKDPKKWWGELARARGRKDYDWSHLAMRYWPERVDGKCQDDPSLGVAHGCFWRYHPARAWAWELRLQDEIEQGFRIEEGPYQHPDGAPSPDHVALRAAYLAEYPNEALEAVEKEAVRRMGRGENKKLVPELTLLEPGLWSALPDACWALELKLSEKQGLEFHLRAPDEPEARAAFEAAHPDKVQDREQLVAGLEPAPDLFAALEDEECEPTVDLDEEDGEE